MSDENKHNLVFFDAASMVELFARMQAWQDENNKRFLSIAVESDLGKFCCIALTNPTEVIIMDGRMSGGATVYEAKGHPNALAVVLA